LGLFCLITAGAGIYMTRGLENVKSLSIQGIAVNSIKDGTYTGSYKAGRFSNQVAVTVTNQKIVEIKALKNVTFQQPDLTEQLFQRIIKNQSLQIDMVSGATVTSKAYLKAIENALIEE